MNVCDGSIGNAEGTVRRPSLLMAFLPGFPVGEYGFTCVLVLRHFDVDASTGAWSVKLDVPRVEGRGSASTTAWVGSALVIHCSCGFCAVWLRSPSRRAGGQELSSQ